MPNAHDASIRVRIQTVSVRLIMNHFLKFPQSYPLSTPRPSVAHPHTSSLAPTARASSVITSHITMIPSPYLASRTPSGGVLAAAAVPVRGSRPRQLGTSAARAHPSVVARARGFDANDPLTWNQSPGAVEDDDDASMFADAAAPVADIQSLSDADLAELVGASGAYVPQMVDDDAFAAMTAEIASSRAPENAAEAIAVGIKEYADGLYADALATFTSAMSKPGSGPVRYRKSLVAPAGPSLGFKPRELSAGEEIAIWYNSACCYAKLENVTEGLAALNKALERGYDEYPAIRRDADIEILRRDPRFEGIMARYEPQGAIGKLFDAMNGPKRGESIMSGFVAMMKKK
jgi:hypothetical protein